MRSVGVAGRPSAEFRRALERGSLLQAESNARLVNAQTGKSLPLRDALGLLLLMAQERDDRFVRAALRWHARFETELRDLTLAESLLALSASIFPRWPNRVGRRERARFMRRTRRLDDRRSTRTIRTASPRRIRSRSSTAATSSRPTIVCQFPNFPFR